MGLLWAYSSLNLAMASAWAVSVMSIYGRIAAKLLCPVNFMTTAGAMPRDRAVTMNVRRAAWLLKYEYFGRVSVILWPPRM